MTAPAGALAKVLPMRPVLMIVLATVAAVPVQAQEWERLGTGRVFTNDALGDLTDRWRTASYTASWFRGRMPWQGELPANPGQVLEWRLRGEIVTPSDLANPAPDDRRYAGMLSAGVHTYWDVAGFETRAGLDLVMTGPQTHLDELQTAIHDILSLPKPDSSDQIGDAVYPTLSIEMARSYVAGTTTVRPFIEAQAGIEDFVRIGADVVVGTHGMGGLLMRDPVTGHRVTAIRGAETAGFSLVLGADAAAVTSSELLPEGGAAVLSEERYRVRAGGHWMTGTTEVFYGISYLSPEFEQQDEGQVVGALNVRILF